MKKMKFAALAATALLALSCSDDENDTTTSPLRGRWKLTSITASQAVDANGDGVASTDLMSEFGGTCFSDSYIEFLSDKTYTSVMGTIPTEGGVCTSETTEGIYTFAVNGVTTFKPLEGGETERTIYGKFGNLLRLDIPDFIEGPGENGFNITTDARIMFTKQ